MGGFSVNDAMSRLGIYKSEAEALDALDGKKDGKISKDIFAQAQEALNNAEVLKTEGYEDEVLNLSKFSKVAQSLGRTIAEKMGFGGFVSSSNKNEDVESTMDGDDRHMQVLNLVSEATEYIKQHKTLDGFRFTGAPKDVKNIQLSVDNYYGNSENDVVTFDKDGKAVVEKVVDGIAIEIHYTVDDTDYALGAAVEFDEEETNAEGNTPPPADDSANTNNAQGNNGTSSQNESIKSDNFKNVKKENIN